MNKFVKGAKNLAFALSFVTVAACGNVKKGDLEAGLKGLEEKIDSKLKGKADNGTVDENQGYVRKNDLSDFVKSEDLDGKIDGLGKDIESLKGVFEKGDAWEMSSIFGDVVGNFVDCSKYKISVGKMDSDAGKIVIGVKNGDKVVCNDIFGGKSFAAGREFDKNLDCLRNVVGRGGAVDFNAGNVFKNHNNNVKFGDCDSVNDLFVELCSLLNVLGIKADKCGLNGLFTGGKVLGGNAGGFLLSCGKFVSGLNAFAGEEVCKVEDSEASGGEEKTVVLLKDVFGGKTGDKITVKQK